MMREHLFRGKTMRLLKGSRYKEGDWAYGWLSSPNSIVRIGLPGGTDDMECVSEVIVDPETVGEFTGVYDGTEWKDLTDAEKEEFLSRWSSKTGEMNTEADWKGRMVFEGDIIKYHFGMEKAVIRFGMFESGAMMGGAPLRQCGFYAGWETKGCRLRKDLGYWFGEMQTKVIGNIHDDPELAGDILNT